MAIIDFEVSPKYIILAAQYQGVQRYDLTSEDIQVMRTEVSKGLHDCLTMLAWGLVEIFGECRMAIIGTDGLFARDMRGILRQYFALGRTDEHEEKLLRQLAREFRSWVGANGGIIPFPAGSPIRTLVLENSMLIAHLTVTPERIE